MNSPQRAITLMRRAGVIASVIAAAVVAAVVVGAIAAVAFFNTDAGRRTLERMTARWTSGTVVMAGLSGRFPDALQLSHLELYDAAGRWAQFNDVTLDWSPRRLLGRVFRIDTLLIGRAEVLRAPQSAGASSGGGGPWPVRVEVARLHVTRADLGEQLAGFSAAIEVEGSLQGRSSEEGAAELAVTRLDGAGRYTASARADATRVKLDVTLAEPARGLLQSLAGLPELGPVAGNASVDGPRNAAPLQLRLQAGGLTASANGTLDLAGEAAALDFTLEAAAMKPAAGLSWSRVSVRGRSRGPWSVPVGTAHARIDGLQVGEYRAEHVQADLQGDR